MRTVRVIGSYGRFEACDESALELRFGLRRERWGWVDGQCGGARFQVMANVERRRSEGVSASVYRRWRYDGGKGGLGTAARIWRDAEKDQVQEQDPKMRRQISLHMYM